jgi:hypothetical protein
MDGGNVSMAAGMVSSVTEWWSVTGESQLMAGFTRPR